MRCTYLVINPVRFSHTPDVTAVNQKQFDAHYKLYEGYVNQNNKIVEGLKNVSQQELADANTTNGEYRGLKKGETYALNGVILHELYFRNMGGTNKEPCDQLITLIEKYFGTMEEWSKEFIATAKASRGWVVLCYEQRTDSLRNCLLDLHDEGAVYMSIPLIVLDMYEHAYAIQYGIDKAKYIDAFMKNIHWDIVCQRVKYWKLDQLHS